MMRQTKAPFGFAQDKFRANLAKLIFRKIFPGILFLLLFSSSVWAQTRTITGTVADETGEAMPFVTIGAVGATVGTVTDMNGRFSLTIPQGTQVIRVSFIGFKTQDVTLTAAVNYTIRMESEVAMLEQVVIVGNVERNRESFTGAFSTVSGSELKQMGSQNSV